jgi:hypothetical protein
MGTRGGSLADSAAAVEPARGIGHKQAGRVPILHPDATVSQFCVLCVITLWKYIAIWQFIALN